MYSVRLMNKLESRSLVAAVILVGLATLACKGKLGGAKADGGSTTTTTAAGGGGDVCQVSKDDMCLEFDDHSLLANQKSCDRFDGNFQSSGVCAKELRIGACRVAKDNMNAIYFGGDNNDIHDSQEHCEETLHGVFTSTPAKDVTATWVKTDLSFKMAGYTILAPAQTKQELHGDSVSIERISGYYGIMITKEKMSVTEVKKDAREGSEYFAFSAFVTDTPTKLVWKVRNTKNGDIGYKFSIAISAGTDITCESLTVFDNMELADANIASCLSIARK